MSEAGPQQFSDVAIDHARTPRHNGLPARYNGRGRATGSCGDTMALWLHVAQGVVDELSFVTDGCGTSLAAGSMTACLAHGQRLETCLELTASDVLTALGEFPEEAHHCAELSAEVLRAACDDYLTRGRHEPDTLPVKLALPLVDGRLAPSVDRCEQYATITVEPETFVLGPREDLAPPPADRLPDWLVEQGVSVLIAGGLDETTAQPFLRRGIDVRAVARAEKPEALVASWILNAMTKGPQPTAG